jgi:hypothetical protein
MWQDVWPWLPEGASGPIFAQLKPSAGNRVKKTRSYIQEKNSREKGGLVKEINLEARTVAVLIGLAIGLGMAVHGAFFFIAFLIALAAVIDWAVEAMFEHARLSDPKLLRDCNLPESAPNP